MSIINYPLFTSSTKSLIEIYYGLHLVEVVGDLRDAGVEESILSLDNLQIAGALRGVEQLGVLHILLVDLHLLLVEQALLIAGVIGQEGIAHLVACLEDGLLEGVESLFLLRLGHLQTSHDLTMLEDGLRERANG